MQSVMIKDDHGCKYCGKRLTEGEYALGFDHCGEGECDRKAMQELDARLKDHPIQFRDDCPVCHTHLDEYGCCPVSDEHTCL